MPNAYDASGAANPQGPRVLAQAPERRMSAEAIVQPYNMVARAVGFLGNVLDESTVDWHRQAAEEAVVTRGPDGQVKLERRPFEFSAGDRAYNATIQQRTLAQGTNRTKNDLTEMQAKHLNDPAGFQAEAGKYIKTLATSGDKLMRGPLSAAADEMAGQIWRGLTISRAQNDVKSAQVALLTQIQDRKDNLIVLARQGGTETEEYKRGEAQLTDLYGALGSNSLYGYPKERIASEIASFKSENAGWAVVGNVDRIYSRAGKAEAAKELKEKILDNPGLNLSDKERQNLYTRGLARLDYLSGETKAQVDAFRSFRDTLIGSMRDPASPIADSVVDDAIGKATSLGDSESVQKLTAARTESRRVASLAGQTDEQRMRTVGAVATPPTTSVDNVWLRMLGKETDGNPASVSPKGAAGLAQLMPATAREVATQAGRADLAAMSDEQLRRYWATPEGSNVNLTLGRRYFDSMVIRYKGDIEAATIAYNGGPARADAWLKRGRDDSVLPAETVDYRNATVGGSGGIVPILRPGGPVGKVAYDGDGTTVNGTRFTGSTSPLDVARQFVGMNETTHRETLAAFMTKAGGQKIDPKLIPWCAAFVDSVLAASGRQSMGTLRAADYLRYGTATDQPTQGDVVVFKSLVRGSSGHLGFVVGIENGRVRYVAGNDENGVKEDTLPLSSVAGFRRPPEATASPTPLPVQVARNSAGQPGTMPYTPEQVKANPFLASEWAKSAVQDKATMTSSASRIGDSILAGLKTDNIPHVDTLAGFLQTANQYPDMLAGKKDQVLAAIAGWETAQTALGSPTAAGSSILQQAQVRAQGTSIAQQAAADFAKETHDRGVKAMQDEPWSEGARRGWWQNPPPALDFSSPGSIIQGMSDRGNMAAVVAARTGEPVRSAIAKQDVDSLKAGLTTAAPEAITTFVSSILSNRPEVVDATIADPAVVSTLKALALTDDPQRYKAAMSGMSSLKNHEPRKFADAFGQETFKQVQGYEVAGQFTTDEALKKVLQTRQDPASADTLKAWQGEGDKRVSELSPKEIGRLVAKHGADQPMGASFGDRSPETPEAAAAMQGDFRAIMRESVVLARGDVDKALELASTRLGTLYAVSGVNNGTYMKFSPERYLRDDQGKPATINGSFDWVKTQLQEELRAKLGADAALGPEFDPRTGAMMRNEAAGIGAPVDIPYRLVPYSGTQAAIARGLPPVYQVTYQNPKTGEWNVMPAFFQPDVGKAMTKERARLSEERAAALAWQQKIARSLPLPAPVPGLVMPADPTAATAPRFVDPTAPIDQRATGPSKAQF